MNIFSYLKIPESSTPDEVKAAYRSAARDLHPDFTGSSEAMSVLNQLYQDYVESLTRPALFMSWIADMIDDDNINSTDDILRKFRSQKVGAESLIQISMRRLEKKQKKLTKLEKTGSHLDKFLFAKLELSIEQLKFQIDSTKSTRDEIERGIKYIENLEWEDEKKDFSKSEMEFIHNFFRVANP